MAEADDSPVVRLYLASATQLLPVEARWDLLAALTSHGEDQRDHNLPAHVLVCGRAAWPMSIPTRGFGAGDVGRRPDPAVA